MVVNRRLQGEVDDRGEEEEEEEEKSKGTMLFFPKLAADQIPPEIENRLRLLIRKEVERAVSRFFDPSPSSLPSETPREGCLQLRFIRQLPSPIFTGFKILADDDSPIRIELWDTRTNLIVHTGPLSTIKILIVPLNGDFGSADEEKDWNEVEFSANVVHERQGRRPLIVGEKRIDLREGVAHIGNISFTDNSSWTRNRHFRLGARIDPEIPSQERIKEARSGRFIVKDQRGEHYRKHFPPSLNDEVWRLKKIAKDRTFHSRLASRGISTVKEFLRWHEIDPVSLRKILGSNVPNGIWTAIVEHAASCPVNADEHESYVYTDSSPWLLFDCLYRLIAASFDCFQTSNRPHDLPVPQRRLLQDLKREAYQHMSKWIQVPSASDALPADASASVGPSTSSQHPGFLLPSVSTYNEVEPPFPLIYPTAQPLATNALYAGEELWPGQQALLFQSSMPGNSWTLGSEAEPAEAHLLSHLLDFGAPIPTYRKRSGGWCKIRAVVTFRSLKRYATARRRAKSKSGLLPGNSKLLYSCH